MIEEHDHTWKNSEHPVAYFNQVENAISPKLDSPQTLTNTMILPSLPSTNVRALTKCQRNGIRRQVHLIANKNSMLGLKTDERNAKTAGFGMAEKLILLQVLKIIP